jgi:transposase
MHLVKLSLSERRALAQQIHRTKDFKVLKRSQALIWLSEGIAASQVAKRLGISRRTIYSWVSSYQNRRSNAFGRRLQDRPKPGRPPRKSPRVLRALGALLQESPRYYGYHYTEWTASLLAKVLKRNYDLDISTKTIRRCLKQSHYVWKRPGYALARQSPTWAQEKGGSREGSTRIQDVSCSSRMKPSSLPCLPYEQNGPSKGRNLSWQLLVIIQDGYSMVR